MKAVEGLGESSEGFCACGQVQAAACWLCNLQTCKDLSFYWIKKSEWHETASMGLVMEAGSWVDQKISKHKTPKMKVTVKALVKKSWNYM